MTPRSAAKADFEFLYDKTLRRDKTKVRVAALHGTKGLSPHRTLAVDENDELIDPTHYSPKRKASDFRYGVPISATMILENLKTAGGPNKLTKKTNHLHVDHTLAGEYFAATGASTSRSESEDAPKKPPFFPSARVGTVARQDCTCRSRAATLDSTS